MCYLLIGCFKKAMNIWSHLKISKVNQKVNKIRKRLLRNFRQMVKILTDCHI